jgi:integrase
MRKRNITDRTLKALKRAAKGKRYEVMDNKITGFGVRVTEKGQRTFILIARYPGSSNPTRRALGEYPTMSLADARAKALDWHKLIPQGKDPRIEEERRAAEQVTRDKVTFAVVAEDFIKQKLPSERKGKEVARHIRREFGGMDPETKKLSGSWAKRPIAELTDIDILTVINAKKATAPSQARNLLGTAKRLFAWAKEQRVYGLIVNPCADLSPSKQIGKKRRRRRILSDDEMFALWRGAKRMGYPCGRVYQLLALTALRLNEAADASWPEFDVRRKIWVIPEERMKGENVEARAHAVPLTDDILAILNDKDFPRFKSGDYLFSTTHGRKPVWVSNKIKKRLDARMLRTLKALARIRGEDPRKVTLPHWVNHDIRRTVRSHLSRLKITEEAREAVLAHVRPGIKDTYDIYDYFDEKREALSLWAARLKNIVEPPLSNVVALRA